MNHLPLRLAIAILLSSAIATAQPPAQSISVTPQCITLKNGETTQLKATILPTEASQTVKWEADYSGEYTIDDNGNITATYTSDDMQSGLIVSATTTDGTNLTAYCSIAKEFSVPESIEILQPEITIHQGETAEITARLLPENGLYDSESISWYSNNRLIGFGTTLSYNAVNTGTFPITAEYTIAEDHIEWSEDGDIVMIEGKTLSAECSVNVTDPLTTTISLSPVKVKLPAGSSTTLTATSYPYPFQRDMQWTSDNPAVATVDGSGNVSAVADGKASITVTAMDGSGASRHCEITVTPNHSENHLNTLLISTAAGATHSIPLAQIEGIYSTTNGSGDPIMKIVRTDMNAVQIPFSDITAISHVHDSGNGISSPTDPKITISTSGRRLIIDGCTEAPETDVYGLNGHLIYSGHSSSIELDNGIYIVIVNKTNIFKIKI